MSFGGVLRPVLTVLAVLGGVLSAPSLAAADDEPAPLVATTTHVSGPASHADRTSHVWVSVTAADVSSVEGGAVTLERRVGGVWQPVAEAVTGADGRARVAVTISRRPGDNTFRATYAGDATYAASTSKPTRVALVRRKSRLTLRAPRRVIDERFAQFTVRWRTNSGLPVAGAVRIQVRKGGKWHTRRTLATNGHGRAGWRHKVRNDSRWRAVAAARPWVRRAVSRVRLVDNQPPGVPVVLPKAAPRPRVKVPAQPRATRPGADVAITAIPNAVWRQMVGRTWHAGCPVGRLGLRLVRVNYWAYDGYRRRGEIVVNARVAGNVAAAFREMYARRLPIRSMYRVDRFGWSSKVHGGNDYKSMAAGNTSAFNCRSVVNSPGVRSPHSYGTAVDVNTWENPYRSRTGIVPNTWWQHHSNPRYAWRSSNHVVVRLMRRHGLRWTYGNGDTQHFDATAGAARLRVAPRCVGHCD